MRWLTLAIILALFGVFIPSGECLRTAPDAKSPEEASSKSSEEIKDLIREREISKRVADKRIHDKEVEAAKRAETVQVRVHAGGVDPLSKNQDVILTTQMSAKDLKAGKFTEVHRRATEGKLAYMRSQGNDTTGEPKRVDSTVATESSAQSSTTTFILLGALGAGAFWYVRRQSAV
ncbi:MAG: hypothetical protein KC940_21900 [Candidatus Omnitrophica bacterium]|nr:hypothetical protein [Candidatus Omnitrophota bacterium]